MELNLKPSGKEKQDGGRFPQGNAGKDKVPTLWKWERRVRPVMSYGYEQTNKYEQEKRRPGMTEGPTTKTYSPS